MKALIVNIRKRLLRVSSFILLFILWYLCCDLAKIVAPSLLPPLAEVFDRLVLSLWSGELGANFFATLHRWLLGFCIGFLLGTLIGIVLGFHRKLYLFFELPLEFFRAMPVTAIFPLFLMLFGIGDMAKIAMAAFPTCLLMVVNSAYGVFNVTPERRKVAKVFGASAMQIISKVVFPEALPQVFIGLRLSLSLSLVVSVVSEMFIGTDTGIGQRIYDSYLTNSAPSLYSYLLLVGLMGYIINKLAMHVENRVIFWAGR